MNRISTVRPLGIRSKPVWVVSTVEIRWLPAWPRCVTEESRHSPKSCRSNYGLARWQPVYAGKVTVELRYDYGTNRWTGIELQKQYLSQVWLSYTQVICIVLYTFFIRLNTGWWGKGSLLTPLSSVPPTLIAILFALVCNLSYVLCKWHICYKFHGIFIDIHMLPNNAGLCRLISVTHRSDTIFSPNRVWSVALPAMYECTRNSSRFVPVRPGSPTTNCRDAPGRRLTANPIFVQISFRAIPFHHLSHPRQFPFRMANPDEAFHNTVIREMCLHCCFFN